MDARALLIAALSPSAVVRQLASALLISLLALMATSPARATIIDFEGLPSGTMLTNQLAGLTFTNSVVLTAGVSLNELDFPPHSGTNVINNFGSGGITINFAIPLASVGGYFTYTAQLTLNAFDASNNLLGTIQSSFSENIGSSNNPPNEFLSLFATDIRILTITNASSGAPFTFDDLTFQAAAVPEPGTLALLGAGLAGLAADPPPSQGEGVTLMAKRSSPILALCTTLFLGWSTAASAIPILERVSPLPTSYVFGVDFDLMFSAVPGDVTGILQDIDLVLPPGPVPNTSTSGCEAADFSGFVSGRIVLLQRGTCFFSTKVENAAAAGAIAALVFNEGQPGRTDANSGTCNPIVCSIPTLTTSFAVGDFLAQLLDGGPVTVRIAVTAEDLATAVPEPGTLSIFGFIAAALSLMRRRRSAVTPH